MTVPYRRILGVLFMLLVAPAAWGQSWVQAGGPTGAQVSGMAVAPDGTLYTGTDYGILYRSTDEGGSWTSVSAGLPVVQQYDVVAAPNWSIFVAGYDSGAYRSTDRGGTWTKVTAAIDTGRNKPTKDLAVASDGTLYLSKAERVFRSTDNGSSWTACAKAEGRTIGTIVLDSHDHLFGVGLGAGLGYNMHLLRSTDRGESWTDLGRPGDTMERFTIWIDRQDRLTALVSDTNIYRSSDGGASWVRLNSPVPGRGLDAIYSNGNLMLTSADGIFLYRSTDNGLTWRVHDSLFYDILAEAFADPGNGTLYFGDWQKGVYRSDDSGRTWHRSASGMKGSTVIAMLSVNGGPLYACTQYTGTYRSTDRGESWANRSPLINPRAEAMARVVALGPQGELLAGGYIAIYRSTDRGESWSKFVNSAVVNAIASWRDGRIWVATTLGTMISLDNGATWQYSFSSKEAFTVAVDSGGTFYHSTEDGTYRAGSSLKGLGTSKVIAVHPDGSVYFGGGGGIRISRDSGKTFTPKALSSKAITSITFARNGQAYAVAQNDGVYRQTGDTTWEPANDGLPRKYATAIVSDADGYLYVSTWGNSIYRSAAPVPASAPRDRASGEALDLAASPNPFTARAVVAFTLGAPSAVTVTVCDQLGREVARPIDGGVLERGRHEVVVDGEALPAGVYHVTVIRGGRTATTAVVRR